MFGVIGVIVAVLGLYGTMAYSVARRTNEIGVRLALGASPGQVRRMVLRLATGLLVGAFPAWRASRVDPTRALRAD